MAQLEVSRTLVKSAPELWAECSDASSLERHLGDGFGEIRITRLEPESAVAWEGAHASGTVRLEPSGWGTRVTITTAPVGEPAPEPPAPEVADDPVPPHAAPLPDQRRGLWSRITGWFRSPPSPDIRFEASAPQPEATPEPAASTPEPEPEPGSPDRAAILAAALDSLGSAHHRPFSRG